MNMKRILLRRLAVILVVFGLAFAAWHFGLVPGMKAPCKPEHQVDRDAKGNIVSIRTRTCL